MLNSHQKNAVIFICLFVIGTLAYLWYLDHAFTTDRVTNSLRPKLEAQVQRENEFLFEYAEALHTNQVIWDIKNSSDRDIETICEEQLLKNVLALWAIRNHHWKNEYLDERRVMTESLDLLKVLTARDFAKKFMKSKVYEDNDDLYSEFNPNWSSELSGFVGRVLLESGRGNGPGR